MSQRKSVVDYVDQLSQNAAEEGQVQERVPSKIPRKGQTEPVFKTIMKVVRLPFGQSEQIFPIPYFIYTSTKTLYKVLNTKLKYVLDQEEDVDSSEWKKEWQTALQEYSKKTEPENRLLFHIMVTIMFFEVYFWFDSRLQQTEDQQEVTRLRNEFDAIRNVLQPYQNVLPVELQQKLETDEAFDFEKAEEDANTFLKRYTKLQKYRKQLNDFRTKRKKSKKDKPDWMTKSGFETRFAKQIAYNPDDEFWTAFYFFIYKTAQQLDNESEENKFIAPEKPPKANVVPNKDQKGREDDEKEEDKPKLNKPDEEVMCIGVDDIQEVMERTVPPEALFLIGWDESDDDETQYVKNKQTYQKMDFYNGTYKVTARDRYNDAIFYARNADSEQVEKNLNQIGNILFERLKKIKQVIRNEEVIRKLALETASLMMFTWLRLEPRDICAAAYYNKLPVLQLFLKYLARILRHTILTFRLNENAQGTDEKKIQSANMARLQNASDTVQLWNVGFKDVTYPKLRTLSLSEIDRIKEILLMDLVPNYDQATSSEDREKVILNVVSKLQPYRIYKIYPQRSIQQQTNYFLYKDPHLMEWTNTIPYQWVVDAYSQRGTLPAATVQQEAQSDNFVFHMWSKLVLYLYFPPDLLKAIAQCTYDEKTTNFLDFQKSVDRFLTAKGSPVTNVDAKQKEFSKMFAPLILHFEKQDRSRALVNDTKDRPELKVLFDNAQIKVPWLYDRYWKMLVAVNQSPDAKIQNRLLENVQNQMDGFLLKISDVSDAIRLTEGESQKSMLKILFREEFEKRLNERKERYRRAQYESNEEELTEEERRREERLKKIGKYVERDVVESEGSDLGSDEGSDEDEDEEQKLLNEEKKVRDIIQMEDYIQKKERQKQEKLQKQQEIQKKKEQQEQEKLELSKELEGGFGSYEPRFNLTSFV